MATYNAGLIRCQADAPCAESRIPGEERVFEISSLRSVPNQMAAQASGPAVTVAGVTRLNKGRWQRFNAEGGMLNGDYVHDLEVVHDKGSEPEDLGRHPQRFFQLPCRALETLHIR